MLNLIDRLPRDSYYTQAVTQDEEHASMLLRASEGNKADPHPPMSTWSAEVAVLADLVDAVNSLRLAFIQANSKNTSQKPKFVPYTRPKTVMEKVRAKHKQSKHEELVAKVLPHRRREG